MTIEKSHLSLLRIFFYSEVPPMPYSDPWDRLPAPGQLPTPQMPTYTRCAVPNLARAPNRLPGASRPMLDAISSVFDEAWCCRTAVDLIHPLIASLALRAPHLPNQGALIARNCVLCNGRARCDLPRSRGAQISI